MCKPGCRSNRRLESMSSYKAMHCYFFLSSFSCYFVSCCDNRRHFGHSRNKVSGDIATEKKKIKTERMKEKRSGLTTSAHEVNTSLFLFETCCVGQIEMT